MVFQVLLNFDPANEILKIRSQIYVLMKKVIILKKIQATMKTFTAPFFNHFSLSLNRKKSVVMRAMRKKQSFSDILQKGVLKNFANFTGKHPCGVCS